jgi:putative endonuclease
MGYFYILECSDGTYYSGSARELISRVIEHRNGEGANYTRKRLPVKLIYFEKYTRVVEAFYREKQVQNWSHKKKKALVKGKIKDLSLLSKKIF